uniref:ras-specific guanine nucleotide-releasing factor RalGPS1-like isoform X2 n=1 Tax=Myxine glutinosa TaxID=7769 RepID=UPI0035900446
MASSTSPMPSIVSPCLPMSEASSSVESLGGQEALQVTKSYDAVVFDVLKVTPEHFAGQIALLDAPVFKAIQPEELASCGWNKKEKHNLAPNVVAFTRRFNQVSFWVVQEILNARTLKIRAEILSHFIKIAKKLHEINDFHASVAVLSALQSVPIFRLSRTWGLLSRKDRASYEKMDYIMSKENNYKHMRDDLTSLRRTPCIPYLGIFLSDLIYIDSAYPPSDGIMESEQRSLHMNNILRTLSDFQQSCHYDHLSVLSHIQKYLRSVRYIEELQKFVEDENYKLSLQLEQASSVVPRITSPYESVTGCMELPTSPEQAHDREFCRRRERPSTPPPYFTIHSCGHRKSHSLSYGMASCRYEADSRSLTFPHGKARHLLDDSLLETGNVSKQSSHVNGMVTGSSEGSSHSEETPWPQFESSPNNPMRSDHPNTAGGSSTWEGVLKRKTAMKDGRKPMVSTWTRYWVVLSGSLLIHYAGKALKPSERKHFKSAPCKVVSVVGWMVFMPDDAEHPNVFQLTDSDRGNSYKYQADSRPSAVTWCKHLDVACKSHRTQVPANLMTFE